MHTYEILLLHFKRIKVYVSVCKARKKRITNYIKRLDLISTSTRKFTRLPQIQNNQKSHDQCINIYIYYFFLLNPISSIISAVVCGGHKQVTAEIIELLG